MNLWMVGMIYVVILKDSKIMYSWSFIGNIALQITKAWNYAIAMQDLLSPIITLYDLDERISLVWPKFRFKKKEGIICRR